MPAEDTSNSKAQVFEILWKDCGSIKLNDMKLELDLGVNYAKARFDDAGDYNGFK